LSFPKDTDRTRSRDLLKKHAPVQLPTAHHALTAKLIERAGFHGYQIGGFVWVGVRHGLPDINLTPFAAQVAAIRDIVAECRLPVLFHADGRYGDAKNVTHTIWPYEASGLSAFFIENQVTPRRNRHMSGKRVVAVKGSEA
jgi:2-methylisocitrate lyase-like PEP mutase family enzyme